MIYSIVLFGVGAVLAVLGFRLTRPKNGDVSVGGGGYVDLGPQERPQGVRDAGKIMLGIGIIMIVGGLVFWLSRMVMALAGIFLVLAVVALVLRFLRR